MTKLTKEANDYQELMFKELKKMFDGKFKSPMQLPKEEKAKFFKHMDKIWKSKKESSLDIEKSRIAKKVNDYFKFVQDQLKQNYPKDNFKSPMEIKDKEEQKNFFSQVKNLWKKKKVESSK